MLGRRDLDEEEHLRDAREPIRALEAAEQAEDMIASRVREAVGHLRGLDIPGQARCALTDLALAATDRHH